MAVRAGAGGPWVLRYSLSADRGVCGAVTGAGGDGAEDNVEKMNQ